MNKNLFIVALFVLAFLVIIVNLHKDKAYNYHLENLKQEYALKPVPSVDHSKLEVLQRNFNTPQDVTRACISCHTERHKEIMRSSHWNWERTAYIEGRGLAFIGKKNIINNFCIGASANEQACAKCHIGFGMTNDQFDFNNAVNVDCMVCHDNSEEYQKGSSMAGYPARSVNLENVALSVGKPSKINCGTCHFYSGGGNNVKHGDLEESLLACDKEVDVHMAANGMDMSCVACHSAENHVMKGKLYSVSSDNKNRAKCEDCHTNSAHMDKILNNHKKVACQTCHIPNYAKVNSTKMAWLWSEAGKFKDGKPYSEEDEDGHHTYLSTKGKFVWGKNIAPEYIWFNGTTDHYILGDTINSFPVEINPLNGSYDDDESQIIPVKIHRGNQIYDNQTKMLIQPKLFSEEKGDSAFWKDFDWRLASEAGMKRVGLPFSGDFSFVETKMYWPINHMVSPKDKSLDCADCHTRSGGRLADLTDFYLPGRDYNKTVNATGSLLLFLSLLSVMMHGFIRIAISIQRKGFNINKKKD